MIPSLQQARKQRILTLHNLFRKNQRMTKKIKRIDSEKKKVIKINIILFTLRWH